VLDKQQERRSPVRQARAHPNAQWIAQQLTEAYGWTETPRYLILDRDCAYGAAFIRRVGAMRIRGRPISARSPWQNGYAERLIGSIRRDCLDHVVVFGERHLRQLLGSYQTYYNELRTDLALRKDAPVSRVLRRINVFVTAALADVHEQFDRYYSEIGRPSVDPELMIRMLIAGYCYGLRSERRHRSPASAKRPAGQDLGAPSAPK
jgi:hypothetical protein